VFFVNSCARIDLEGNDAVSASQVLRRQIKSRDDDKIYVSDNPERNEILLIACMLWKVQHLGQGSI